MKYCIASVVGVALVITLVVISLPRRSAVTAEPSVDPDMKNKQGAETAIANETALRLPLVQPKIVIIKSKRRLTLYSNDKVVRAYPIGLGFSPVGDKARQGDGRTPEGEFYVCVKNASSRYYLSLGLSYPDKSHAERGFESGLITRAQFNEIARAIDKKIRPRWDTRLGGEIFIHGNGASSDWTLGCVALDNKDMKELFNAVPKGTLVVIEP